MKYIGIWSLAFATLAWTGCATQEAGSHKPGGGGKGDGDTTAVDGTYRALLCGYGAGPFLENPWDAPAEITVSGGQPSSLGLADATLAGASDGSVSGAAGTTDVSGQFVVDGSDVSLTLQVNETTGEAIGGAKARVDTSSGMMPTCVHWAGPAVVTMSGTTKHISPDGHGGWQQWSEPATTTVTVDRWGDYFRVSEAVTGPEQWSQPFELGVPFTLSSLGSWSETYYSTGPTLYRDSETDEPGQIIVRTELQASLPL
jgi:hypothetical protein